MDSPCPTRCTKRLNPDTFRRDGVRCFCDLVWSLSPEIVGVETMVRNEQTQLLHLDCAFFSSLVAMT